MVAEKPVPFQWLWRTLDIVVGGIALVLTSPAYLILPLLHRCVSDDTPIFRQKRIGKVDSDKCEFLWVNKFRTMFDIEGPKADSTKRGITPLGFYLRPLGIDEIPQAWQILKGEMSLFGPRPFSTEDYAKIFSILKDPQFCGRTRGVAPGIFSPGGILIRNPHTKEELRQRIALDLSYQKDLTDPRLHRQIGVRLRTAALFVTHGPRMVAKARGQ